ncbi:MAG: O-antigen ligase family protein, partial [Vicinamibacteraceae bacterium]
MESAGEIAYEASPLRGLALGVLCAKISLVVLVFDPFAMNVFSQPKALASHSLTYVLVGLLSALAFQHGRVMVPRSPLHLPVAAFGAAYVLAAMFAVDHRVALYGAPDRGLGLGMTLDNVALYAAAAVIVRTRADLAWVARTLFGTTVVLALYAAMQKLGLDPIGWASGFGENRPFTTMGNAGALGVYMSAVAVGAATIALAGMTLRWATIGLLCAALLGVWLAGARAAVVGLVIGGTVAIAPLLLSFISRRIRLVAIGGLSIVSLATAGLLALVILAGTPSVLTASPQGLPDMLASRGGSITGRLEIYRAAIEMVRDRPILGVGPDNYVVAFPKYRAIVDPKTHESDAPQSSTHSWLFKVLTDAGLVGLVSFASVILVATALAVRSGTPWSRASLAAIAAFLGTGLFSINHIATEWMPWLGFGVIASRAGSHPKTAPDETMVEDGANSAASRRASRRGRHSAGKARGPRQLLPGAAIVIGVMLAMTPVRAIQAAHDAQNARQAYR